MFTIKICGITTSEDAKLAFKFGAGAIGLNFYAKSLRSVTAEQASNIRGDLADDAQVVGIFVNSSVQQISTILNTCSLSHVQLHGDETTDFMKPLLTELKGVDIIRALRFEASQIVNARQSVQSEIAKWIDAGASAILLDALVKGQFGGTGAALPWQEIHGLETNAPLILAGGLDCNNVAQAIKAAHPFGVDVASGVESFPGKKDHQQMKDFIEYAKMAFDSIA